MIFVRHGQGEHTLDVPESLHKIDPPLTDKGQKQARNLRKELPLTEEDLLVSSPVRRALQTASIWSEGVDCLKVVSPFVGPRMFPQNPEWETLPCDELMDKEKVATAFQEFRIHHGTLETLWKRGINQKPKGEFELLASELIEWCKEQGKKEVYIVSHDGTITSYRQLLEQKTFSRSDFPAETGWEILHIAE
ncbi:histidine phosphatase family protein [Halobacillus sp. BBL2006]|uniref:histidine phosphatase family protein n=1 Tax=Halobacillus sp. BBL2006 TaxID=1543706 RepID=UPI001E6294BD|nr:histidine phosphatase family protein [Halobacillus sp. BBL2006]